MSSLDYSETQLAELAACEVECEKLRIQNQTLAERAVAAQELASILNEQFREVTTERNALRAKWDGVPWDAILACADYIAYRYTIKQTMLVSVRACRMFVAANRPEGD